MKNLKARDLMGMQVGTLTVIAFDEERHKKIWLIPKLKLKIKLKDIGSANVLSVVK